ncbi:MAG: hypothetical protein QOH58_3616, partial [Thermoleophilaceae bacterium]|nr:hypothetical protein [Thermoleophilaceae bacterium]
MRRKTVGVEALEPINVGILGCGHV